MAAKRVLEKVNVLQGQRTAVRLKLLEIITQKTLQTVELLH